MYTHLLTTHTYTILHRYLIMFMFKLEYKNFYSLCKYQIFE